MDEQKLETMIAEKAKSPKRLTPDMIKSKIIGEYFHVPPGTTLTLCVLKLQNGYTVTGESACVDPANFDPQIGKTVARDNATRKIWPLEGYLLAEKMFSKKFASEYPHVVVQPHDEMEQYIGTKIVNAQPMTRAEYTRFRGWTLPADENGADPGYLVEYTDRVDRQVAGFQGYVTWSPKDVFEASYHLTHDDPLVLPAELGEVQEVGAEPGASLHFDV